MAEQTSLSNKQVFELRVQNSSKVTRNVDAIIKR
jgi:hypothetical protein